MTSVSFSHFSEKPMDAIFDSREFFGKNRKTTEIIFVRREWLHKMGEDSPLLAKRNPSSTKPDG